MRYDIYRRGFEENGAGYGAMLAQLKALTAQAPAIHLVASFVSPYTITLEVAAGSAAPDGWTAADFIESVEGGLAAIEGREKAEHHAGVESDLAVKPLFRALCVTCGYKYLSEPMEFRAAMEIVLAHVDERG